MRTCRRGNGVCKRLLTCLSLLTHPHARVQVLDRQARIECKSGPTTLETRAGANARTERACARAITGRYVKDRCDPSCEVHLVHQLEHLLKGSVHSFLLVRRWSSGSERRCWDCSGRRNSFAPSRICGNLRARVLDAASRPGGQGEVRFSFCSIAPFWNKLVCALS